MSFGWTHPICEDCWQQHNPGRPAARLMDGLADQEQCCRCGRITTAGIYVRANPATVLYPAEDDE
jgi:hypothetical protein